MQCPPGVKTSGSAADRVFVDCRGAGILAIAAYHTGARYSDGESGRGSRRRGEQEPRPGCLDAVEARERTPGRPGCQSGAQGLRAIGGRAPARAHSSVRGSGWRPVPERGCSFLACPYLAAVALSDTGGQGERAEPPARLRGETGEAGGLHRLVDLACGCSA